MARHGQVRRCALCFKKLGVTVPTHGMNCPFFKPCVCCINQPLPLQRRSSRLRTKYAQKEIKNLATSKKLDNNEDSILRVVPNIRNSQQIQTAYNIPSTYQALPEAVNMLLLLTPNEILAGKENFFCTASASQETKLCVKSETVDESGTSLPNIDAISCLDTSRFSNAITSTPQWSVEGGLNNFAEITYAESDNVINRIQYNGSVHKDEYVNMAFPSFDSDNRNISSTLETSSDIYPDILNHYAEMIDNDSSDALLQNLFDVIDGKQELQHSSKCSEDDPRSRVESAQPNKNGGAQNGEIVRQDEWVAMASSPSDLGLNIEPTNTEWSLVDYILEKEEPDMGSIIKQALETVNAQEIDYI